MPPTEEVPVAKSHLPATLPPQLAQPVAVHEIQIKAASKP